MLPLIISYSNINYFAAELKTLNMNDSTLINNIKNIASQKYYSGTSGLYVDDFMSEICTLIYPYINELKYNKGDDANKYGTIKSLCEAIKKHINKNVYKIDFAELSKNALTQYFKQYFIGALDLVSKREYLKSIKIVRIEDNGYISYIANEKVMRAYLNAQFAPISVEYGNIDELNIHEPMRKNRENNMLMRDDECNNVNDNIQNAKPLFRGVEYHRAFDADFPYVWKLKITTKEYKEIKTNLRNLFLGHTRNNLTKRIQQYCKAIVVYMAEWFKREYVGNNGVNALAEMNPGITIERIITHLNKFDDFFYQTTNGTNRYLSSINALGGFPINYINDEGISFDAIMKRFRRYNQGKIEEDEIFYELQLNDQAYTQSIQRKNGSLRKYCEQILGALREEDDTLFPISEEDMEEKPVKEFIQRIKNEYQNEEIKFDCSWIVWKDDDKTVTIQPRVSILNPPFISYEKLREWNCEDCIDLQIIYLTVTFDDNVLDGNKKRQSKIVLRNTFDENRGFLIDKDSILLENFNLGVSHITIGLSKDLITFRKLPLDDKPFNVPHFFELYGTEYYDEWTTRTNNHREKAILFVSSYYNINSGCQHPEEVVETITNTILNWCNIQGELMITGKEDGKEYSFYQTNQMIAFIPTEFPKLIDQDKVIDIITKNKVTLLFGKCFKVMLLSRRYGDNDNRRLESTDYELEFKQGEAYNYQEWNQTNNPHRGYVTVRVSKNGIEDTCKCYYIPLINNRDSRPLIRNLEHPRINFNIDTNDVIINIGENKGLDFKKPITFIDSENYAKSEDTIQVCVNNEIVIPVYRAIGISQLYFNDKLIKDFGNDKIHVSLPLLMHYEYSGKNPFMSRINSKNGVERKVLHAPKLSELKSHYDTFYYYLETVRINYDWFTENVDEDFKIDDNYKFYFWSFVDAQNEPNTCAPKEISFEDFRSQKRPDCISDIEWNNRLFFQSLKEGLEPKEYFIFDKKPHVAVCDERWNDNEELFSNLHRNNQDELWLMQICIRCFDIAKVHQIPYPLFYPLQLLLGDNKNAEKLLYQYWIGKGMPGKLSDDDNRELSRLSYELFFDWIFISNSMGSKDFKEIEADKNIINGFKSMKADLYGNSLWAKNEMESYAAREIAQQMPSGINDIQLTGQQNKFICQMVRLLRGRDKDLLANEEDFNDITKQFVYTMINEERPFREFYNFLKKHSK